MYPLNYPARAVATGWDQLNLKIQFEFLFVLVMDPGCFELCVSAVSSSV